MARGPLRACCPKPHVSSSNSQNQLLLTISFLPRVCSRSTFSQPRQTMRLLPQCPWFARSECAPAMTGTRWRELGRGPGVTGSPILELALTYVEARVVGSLDADELTIFLGDVVGGGRFRSGPPLLPRLPKHRNQPPPPVLSRHPRCPRSGARTKTGGSAPYRAASRGDAGARPGGGGHARQSSRGQGSASPDHTPRSLTGATVGLAASTSANS